MHFWKNLVVCSSVGPKILALGSHCLTNFQPILDCSTPNFKMTYEHSENIKADCHCQLTLNQTSGFFETSCILVKIWRPQVFLSLVPTCPKNRKNRGNLKDIPTSGTLTTNGNTSSQKSQTVGDFYHVIRRIGIISTLKVPDIPDVGDFCDECEPGCPKNRNSRKNPSVGKS